MLKELLKNKGCKNDSCVKIFSLPIIKISSFIHFNIQVGECSGEFNLVILLKGL